MPLRPLELEDRPRVRGLLINNPFKTDQIRAQSLDGEKVAEFHTERLMSRLTSAESPVFLYESHGRIGLLGIVPATHHSAFFDKLIFSIDPVLTYRLSDREKEEALLELVPALDLRNPEVVWARCDEEEGDLVAALARFGGEYCGTTLRMTRWLESAPAPEQIEGVEMRQANIADLEDLKRLSGGSHVHSHFFRDPYLPRDKKGEIFPNYMESCLGKPDRPCLVAVDSSLGTIGFSLLLCPQGQETRIGRRIGIVDFIAVSTGVQGKGIGRALLAESLRALSSAGYECVELKTMLDNRQAIGFYQKHGFRIVSSDMQFSIGKGGPQRWS